jgi:hypothetical protein
MLGCGPFRENGSANLMGQAHEGGGGVRQLCSVPTSSVYITSRIWRPNIIGFMMARTWLTNFKISAQKKNFIIVVIWGYADGRPGMLVRRLVFKVSGHNFFYFSPTNLDIIMTKKQRSITLQKTIFQLLWILWETHCIY